MLAAAIAAGYAAGLVQSPSDIALGWSAPRRRWPSLAEVWRGVELLVLPQILADAQQRRDRHGAGLPRSLPGHCRAGERAQPRLSTGLANLALAPLGAMPMCHGAGGVQAQHRFGARAVLLPSCSAVRCWCWVSARRQRRQLFALIPLAAVGALLLVAGGDLAISRRLFDAQPSCWPVIAVAAAATLAFNPAIGLLAGCAGEILRKAVLQCHQQPTARGRWSAAHDVQLQGSKRACCDPVQQGASPSRHFRA